MSYVSRKYLNEKYASLKHDLENVLGLLGKEDNDKIDTEDILKVLPNIRDNVNAIMTELENVEIMDRANSTYFDKG